MVLRYDGMIKARQTIKLFVLANLFNCEFVEYR